MKKFTFKGVLDGFRSSVQQNQTKPDQEIQESLRPDHFQLKKVRAFILFYFGYLYLSRLNKYRVRRCC